MESHLLQMRGLKQIVEPQPSYRAESHLLQMRGLKPSPGGIAKKLLVASFTDAWIETKIGKPDEQLNTSRIFYRCVD